MTLPLHPRVVAQLVPPFVPQRRSAAQFDAAWREASCRFLEACFNGATKPQMDQLAAELFRARDLMKACR